ncbi:UNVERIFIED_ORG: hypothetical protein BCL66_103174 [Martelella mediterranea]
MMRIKEIAREPLARLIGAARRAVSSFRHLSLRDWLAYLTCLAVGWLGGVLAVRFNMPLAWFLGPMMASAVVAIAGVPVRAPLFLRPIAVPILGFLLGTAFLPEILLQMHEWLFSALMIPVYLLASGVVSYAYFRFAGRYDAVTAFFSSVAGGLTAMVLMGEYYKGDVTKIAVAQSMRILVVVVVIALVFSTVLGVSSADTQGPVIGWSDPTGKDISWFFICVLGGSLAGVLLRFPTPAMLGPLMFSALLHLTSVTTGLLPSDLTVFAQFVLGVCIGARFTGLTVRTVSVSLFHGTVSALLMLVLSGGIALLVHKVSAIDPLAAWLAFSPGGMTEMGLMSLAIGQSVAYVTVAHVFRLVIVMFVAPFLSRVLVTGR